MLTKPALTALFSRLHGAPFAIVWWDGSQRQFGQGNPLFILHFAQEPDFGSEDPILALGEAYMHGGLDIRGDWNALLDVLYRNRQLLDGPLARMASVVRTLDRMRLKQKQKANIAHHYDLGNDFYRLWLDDSMSYSCAYFARPDMTLMEAQQAKIDHTLVKLALAPDERLLDIGCGWGWLVIRAAQLYGVHAVGITLSREQYEGANARIRKLGLEKLVEVRLENYLEMDASREQFDKIVSIGMFEHVGKKYLPLYLAKVHHLLKEGGLFLLHSIMGGKESPTNSWMRTYIFPGGYVPSLRETVQLFPEFSFELIHLESLRRHYARTLDCWDANFEQCRAEVAKEYGDEFVRMWSLYLRGCAAAFRTGNIDVYQCLLSKGTNNDVPMTAAYMYKDEK